MIVFVYTLAKTSLKVAGDCTVALPFPLFMLRRSYELKGGRITHFPPIFAVTTSGTLYSLHTRGSYESWNFKLFTLNTSAIPA